MAFAHLKSQWLAVCTDKYAAAPTVLRRRCTVAAQNGNRERGSILVMQHVDSVAGKPGNIPLQVQR